MSACVRVSFPRAKCAAPDKILEMDDPKHKPTVTPSSGVHVRAYPTPTHTHTLTHTRTHSHNTHTQTTYTHSPLTRPKLVLPSYFTPPDMGMLIPRTRDGRVLFLLPWEGSALAGTTDQPSAVRTSGVSVLFDLCV